MLFQWCAWVGLGQVKEFFQSNPPWWVKKIQPSLTQHEGPTQPTWIKLGRVGPMGWTVFFFLITIIIKLSIRITSSQTRVNI